MKKLLFLLFSLPLLLMGQTAPPNYLLLYSVPFNYSQSMSGKPVFVVSAPLSTGNTGDPFPVLWDVAVGGGFAPVSSPIELSTINMNWRKQGMMRLDISQNPPDLYWLDANRTSWRNFSETIQKYGIAGRDQTITSDRYINGGGYGLDFYNHLFFEAQAQHVSFRATNGAYFRTPNTYNLSAQNGWVATLLDRSSGLWDWSPATGGGGGGGGPSDNTIYTFSGSLTGTRAVNQAGFPLAFNGGGIGGNFTVSTPATASIEGGAGVKIRTPGVIAGTKTVGQVLKLTNIDGTSEYSTESGSGSGATKGEGTLASGNYQLHAPVPAYPTAALYPDFFAVDMMPSNTSTGVETVSVGAGPAKPVKSPNLSVTFAGDMVANSVARLVFSSVNDCWILSNPASTLAFDPATLSTTTVGGVTTVAVIGGGSTTLYNGNGTLSSARTVTMGANPLTFNGGAGAHFALATSGNVSLDSGSSIMAISGGNANLFGTSTVTVNAPNATLSGANVAINGSTSIAVQTPGLAAATTGWALRKTAGSKVEYSADPTPTVADNSVVAAKLSFVNPQSFMASQGSAGAGIETKLGPLWIIKRGILQRNVANIMFELNSWMVTGTLADVAAWQAGGGTGSNAGIAGIAGHAGINTISTATTASNFQSQGWRSDMIQFEPGNKLYLFVRVKFPALSVSGGEAFKMYIGFGDTSATTADTDCMTFTYTDTENGGAWTLDCGEATVHTTTSHTGVAMDTNWHDLEMEATTDQVDWWFDGVQKTSVTTNIPNGSNKFAPLIRIVGLSGSLARVVQLDTYNAWGVYSY